MVNLCKSHVTALKKVRSNLGGWTVTMTGKAINSVLTKDDYRKIKKANRHIDEAIDILSKCNQELTTYNLRTLNKLVKDNKKTEITRHKGKYYILHICQNNVPVPLYITKEADEIAKEIKLRKY